LQAFNGIYDTGDLAVMDENLYIYPQGRRDGVIKINGYRVSPGEIEEAVKTALGVDVVVAKARDPLRFEVPVVYVKSEAKPEDVKKAVREYIGPIIDVEVKLM